jgi:hypothetical protein
MDLVGFKDVGKIPAKAFFYPALRRKIPRRSQLNGRGGEEERGRGGQGQGTSEGEGGGNSKSEMKSFLANQSI